jgi:hypothetical protein
MTPLPPEFELEGASIYIKRPKGVAIGIMSCIHSEDGTLQGVRVHVDPYSQTSREEIPIKPGEWFVLPPGEDLILTVDQIRKMEPADRKDFEYVLDLESE